MAPHHTGDDERGELDDIANRLRDERPRLTPAEHDSALSRITARRARPSGARRALTAGLVVGLMAAGTGGVIAAGVTNGSSGNAAIAQYSASSSSTTSTSASTTSSPATFSSGSTTSSATVSVLATSSTITQTITPKPPKTVKVSKRKLVIHDYRLPKGTRLASETVTINGKAYRFILHGRPPVPISFVGVACENGTQTVVIKSVTTSGRVYYDRRTYHLCRPGG